MKKTNNAEPMGVNLDGVLDRFTGLLELQRVLFLEFIEARFSEHDLKEIIYLLEELKMAREVLHETNQWSNDTI